MGGGASAPLPDDTSLVIVGGGYGGITLAGHFSASGKMKLVSPEPYFFHNVGALRSCVEPEFARKIFIPFKETFGDSYVQGKVVRINKEANSVELDTGEEIRYTHLVLATGASGSFPTKMSVDHPKVPKEDGVELYKKINKEINDADTIVCIGGGAVGVELAGEIKTDFPKKNVILIHPNKILCSGRLKPSAQSKLQALIRSKGIDLMLEERVSNLSELQLNKCVKDQLLQTASGKEIKADLIFKCTGSKPATAAFKDALGDAVTEKGFIKVDQYLKVEGTESIYAIGDIIDTEEEKMAVAAQAHADLVSKNIKALLSGNKLHPYKAADFIMVVPVGRNGGVGQLFGAIIGNFLSKTIKSKDLFFERYWSQMKQKLPKT